MLDTQNTSQYMEMKAKTRQSNKPSTNRFSKMSFIKWRKERGLKFVIKITELDGKHLAECSFEGETYSSVGKTNSEALRLITLELLDKANLDIKQ